MDSISRFAFQSYIHHHIWKDNFNPCGGITPKISNSWLPVRMIQDQISSTLSLSRFKNELFFQFLCEWVISGEFRKDNRVYNRFNDTDDGFWWFRNAHRESGSLKILAAKKLWNLESINVSTRSQENPLNFILVAILSWLSNFLAQNNKDAIFFYTDIELFDRYTESR